MVQVYFLVFQPLRYPLISSDQNIEIGTKYKLDVINVTIYM